MKRYGRIFADVLCVLLVVSFAVSGIFSLTHIDHECTGEHCPVCAAIASFERLLRGLSAVVALALLRLAALTLAQFCPARSFRGAHRGTLVSLKVLLLN